MEETHDTPPMSALVDLCKTKPTATDRLRTYFSHENEDLCAFPRSDSVIAERLGIHVNTVYTYRKAHKIPNADLRQESQFFALVEMLTVRTDHLNGLDAVCKMQDDHYRELLKDFEFWRGVSRLLFTVIIVLVLALIASFL